MYISTSFATVFLISEIIASGLCTVPIYIGSLQELSNLPEWFELNVLTPKVIEKTLTLINNRSDMLIGYELMVTYKDIEVIICSRFF